ncbi:glucanotransferase domain of glycogen debranching enzyme-domain-containing protein [Flammula alnicola]|nr:glucanotransferase domain of glycogen debranching enzyme-domain-containing protein [Flammula alnicola]
MASLNTHTAAATQPGAITSTTTAHLPPPGVRPITSKARGVCRYYTHPRGCYAGDRCKFLHAAGEGGGEGEGAAPVLLTPYDRSKRCRFYAQGFCKRGDKCWFLHTDEKEKDRDKGKASVPGPSSELEEEDDLCSICFEKPTTYGLLGGCSHIFCTNCIKQWRDPENKPGGVIDSGNTKRCPMCRTPSKFITPASKFWREGTPEKARVVLAYKESMGRVDCRYFQKSLVKNKNRPMCPYGKDCFYQHRKEDGSVHEFRDGVEVAMRKYRLANTRRRAFFDDVHFLPFGMDLASLDFAATLDLFDAGRRGPGGAGMVFQAEARGMASVNVGGGAAGGAGVVIRLAGAGDNRNGNSGNPIRMQHVMQALRAGLGRMQNGGDYDGDRDWDEGVRLRNTARGVVAEAEGVDGEDEEGEERRKREGGRRREEDRGSDVCFYECDVGGWAEWWWGCGGKGRREDEDDTRESGHAASAADTCHGTTASTREWCLELERFGDGDDYDSEEEGFDVDEDEELGVLDDAIIGAWSVAATQMDGGGSTAETQTHTPEPESRSSTRFSTVVDRSASGSIWALDDEEMPPLEPLDAEPAREEEEEMPELAPVDFVVPAEEEEEGVEESQRKSSEFTTDGRGRVISVGSEIALDPFSSYHHNHIHHAQGKKTGVREAKTRLDHISLKVRYQERGESDSPYSIRSQLMYDKSLFGSDLGEQEGRKRVEEILKVAKDEYGLLSLTDVVLNHTANDTPWLVDHPEAGSCQFPAPHPRARAGLGDHGFSASLAAKGLPTTVSSENDVNVLIAAFDKVVRGLNLWQYYVLDTVREKDGVKAALVAGTVEPWTGSNVKGKNVADLADILRHEKKVGGLGRLASRYGVGVDSRVAAGFVQAAFTDLKDAEALANAWVKVVDVLNVPLYSEWEDDTNTAIGNVRNRLKYARLDAHGPRLGEITKEYVVYSLFEPARGSVLYETRPAPDADPLVYSLANNGWIWNADPLQNFALLPSKAYLRREVIVWGDCVKLRYGAQPADNPWLWAHMTSYVSALARTFDGFRIDNCHSTPLEVGTRMMDAARVVCADLYVCAELFTGSEDMDLVFAWGGQAGGLDGRGVYGQPGGGGESDGEGPCAAGDGASAERRSAEDALSTGALVAFSFCAIGSVKGFDELYPKLLDLVKEERRYEVTGLGPHSGIAKVKRVVNELHLEMVLGGYEEGHVHQENDYIVLHRVQPVTQRGSKARGHIDPIKLRRTRAKFILGASITIPSYDIPKDDKVLRGLDHEGPYAEVVVPENFPPGSVMVFETQLQQFDPDLDAFCASGLWSVCGGRFGGLNVILHRADVEERDATGGKFGVYDVPGLGKMVYCGLEGWMHPLRHVMRYNDLGHPLCAHLRDGSWALDYVHERMMRQVDTFPNLEKPALWIKERFERVKSTVPNYMRPKYFALVVSEAYRAARRAAMERCSEFVSSGHAFTQNLALCAVQMHGLVKSASLDPAVPTPSLAAGLPHFTTGWARCWGRDVFISLSGLFLTTGNFEGAKRHILAFASTLKHGLIPNLLDSVRSPRYNSRDSPWWMLQNIQDYVKSAPEGLHILSEPVKRRFPLDDSWVPWDDPRAYACTSSLAEIVQEILQRHAEGIHFREYNAGPNLDMQMKDEGFDIDIGVDWETGLIVGGNRHNCGTWMDKMGESDKAGTRGVPGTPRDGAPIEITGLLKSTLGWLAELVDRGGFLLKAFRLRRVQYQFESRQSTGIYKDVYGSGAGHEWADYQFRCNFAIAMTVAPEMFDERHAMGALQLADQVLRGPLGMKTLDPQDLQYRPNYDNSNDSDDPSIAKGLNYHNGPEWGWPLGTSSGRICILIPEWDPNVTLHYLHQLLLAPRHHVETDPWRGLPELTNADGVYCADSCNTQAWSASTLLDFLAAVHDM